MGLGGLILWDIKFQVKYGFYLLYGILTAFYRAVLFAIPKSWRENAAVLLIFSDPAAMGLFFMGAIVLLEKSQGVSCAFAVSPVKAVEYITAKVISLCALALAAAAILAGIIIATKITSLNQFILWTVPIEIISITGVLQGVIISLLIVSLSTNKLEGMAVAKISALTILGALVPYFIPAPIQYALSFLPSFWVGKAMIGCKPIYMLTAVLLALLWIVLLLRKYKRQKMFIRTLSHIFFYMNPHVGRR